MPASQVERGDRGVHRRRQQAARNRHVSTASGHGAAVPGRSRHRQGADARHAGRRRIQTLQTFLGGLYVNDFNRFGRTWQVLMQAEPRSARSPTTSTGSTCAGGRRHGAAVTLVTVQRRVGPRRHLPLQPVPRRADLGRPAPGLQLGQAAAAMEEVARRGAAGGLRLRMDRHRLPGEAVPRGRSRSSALPRCSCSCSWRRCMRAGPFRSRCCSPCRWACSARCRGVAARLSLRHLHADRHRHADRPGGEERHPDRRVRQAAARAGRARHRCGDGGRPAPPPADSDDFVRVHPRRVCRW